MKFKKLRAKINKLPIKYLLPLVLLVAILPLSIFSVKHQTNTQNFASSIAPTPPEGIYESCDPSLGQQCVDRLIKIGKAGFKVVINYADLYGTETQILAYATAAQKAGVKIIWNLQPRYIWDGTTDAKTFYGKLGTTCGCTDNQSFVRYVVNLVKNNPATWGYNVSEEAITANHDKIKQFSDIVHQTDPSHPRLVVLGTVYPKGENNLDKFADVGEVFIADWYPVGYYPLFTVARTAEIAKIVMANATLAHKQYGMVLQAQSWANYPPGRCKPFPSCAPNPSYTQMKSMYDQLFQNSQPSLVMWYSYFDILKGPTPDQHWKDLTAVINTVPPVHTPTPTMKPTNTPAQKATPTPIKKATPTPTPSLLKAQVKRDLQRKSDLRTIAAYLGNYHLKYQKYPTAGSCGLGANCYVFSTTGGNWIPALARIIPVDPINNGTGPWGTGRFSYAYGNVSKDGQKYDLFTQLENPGDPDRCGLRNYLYGAGIFTTPKHWCTAFGGAYSNQMYQLH